MKHTEHEYITAGYKYETGKAQADTIRAMLDAEHPHDRPEARRLIEQGRTEGRQVSRK
jgi:hypothetical protein